MTINEKAAPSSPRKYKLEVRTTNDMAPHEAFLLAKMRHDFAYIYDGEGIVKITLVWVSEMRDSLAVAHEIAGLQKNCDFPKGDVTILPL